MQAKQNNFSYYCVLNNKNNIFDCYRIWISEIKDSNGRRDVPF